MTGASGGAYHRRVISHDLHALGFDAPDLDALVNSAAEAGAVGVEDVGGFDLLAAYTDPSGARLALMKQKGHDEMETMASLVAPTTHPADSQPGGRASYVPSRGDSASANRAVATPAEYLRVSSRS